LESFDRVYSPSPEAVELYTRQCCLRVSARDLAVMGATLADGGVNPVTAERVIDPDVCHLLISRPVRP
jgi:glutaminase